MLTELHGKGGQVCRLAKQGAIKCPLIVRPTSEDVITGHLFQTLSVLNPYWWVADLLNAALGAKRFHRQVYRRFKITLWKNRPHFPRELLPWPEGSTQVDATLTWENPPTTVYFEMKYGSDLSPQTAGDNGEHGYPSDQLIRNLRVGLWECGYYRRERLFDMEPRDFVMILVAPEAGHELVRLYRNTARLRAAIPQSHRIIRLPNAPFVGELSYRKVIAFLRANQMQFTRSERALLKLLVDYLAHKRASTR